jgi:protein-L-isoaspartate(D-aspartate) O-methyltransferase
VGTGSGYQAAILSRLVQQVYSIERIESLAESAKQRMQYLGYTNIEVQCRDGYLGWPEQAPFDAVIVTAAASHIPPSLVTQLKPGGHMVIPVGRQFMPQQLLLVSKDSRNQIQTRVILDVAFVPLVTEQDRDDAN